MPFRVAIIGSREYPWPENIHTAVRYFNENCPGWILISGGALGVDSWAQQLAEDYGVPMEIYPAHWDVFGKSAGMIRNREIVGRANLVIAFWDGMSPGTKNSIDLAKALKKPCWVVGV
jgi:hypothetical protein